MENKKILKEELYRILEIMKVPNNNVKLLTESPIDDVVGAIVKIGSDAGTEVGEILVKLETELQLPPKSLTKTDVTNLISGVPAQKYAVLGKMVKKMGPDAVDNMVNKIWADVLEDGELGKQIEDLMDELLSKGKKMSPEQFNKFVDDMTDGIVKVNDPNLVKIADGIKRKVKETVKTNPKVKDLIVKRAKEIEGVLIGNELKNIIQKIKDSGKKVSRDFPEDAGDEFYEIYAEKIMKAMGDENTMNLIRKEMINRFGKNPRDWAKTMKPFFDAAGIFGENMLKMLSAITNFLTKNVLTVKGLIGLFVLIVAYEGLSWYSGYKQESKMNCNTPGSPCFCWSKQVASFNDLEEEDKIKVLDSGVGCSDFLTLNPPVAVTKGTNAITGLEEFKISYKDGSEKALSDNQVTPPNQTTKTYQNTESGFLDWYKTKSDAGEIKKDFSSTGYGWEDGAWFGNTPLTYKSENEGWEIPANGRP